jgi:membrane fusion protein (multidrug efflux system)
VPVLDQMTVPRNASAVIRTAEALGLHEMHFIHAHDYLVPQRAVQQGAKGSFVWLINDQNEAEFRPIKVGGWQGEDWFIDAGLEDGETVVVDGALKLRAGVEVEIIEPDVKEGGAPVQTPKAR